MVEENISLDLNTKDSSEHKMAYILQPVHMKCFQCVFFIAFKIFVFLFSLLLASLKIITISV